MATVGPVWRAAWTIGRSGPRGAVLRHTWVIGTVTVALASTLVAVVVALGVLTGIESRDALRARQTPQPSRDVAGYVLDTFATPPLNVVLAQASGDPTDRPPPGLTRWPAPGTAVVSPRVAVDHPVGSTSPWGRVVDVIGDTGLVNPNERYVYANPARYAVPHAPVNAVGGWGGPRGFSGDHRSNHPTGQFLQVMGLLLVAPAVAAAVVCLCAVWHLRRPGTRSSPSMVRPPRPAQGRIAVVAPVCVLLLSRIDLLAVSLPVPVLASVVLLLIAGVVFTTPFAVSWLVGRAAQWADRVARGPAAIVEARCAAPSARTAEVVAVGVVVAMSVCAVTELFGGYYGQEVVSALRADRVVADRILLVKTPQISPDRIRDLVADPGIAYLPIGASDADAPAMLRGTCAQFAAVGAGGCKPDVTETSDLHSAVLDAADGLVPSRVEVLDAASSAPVTRLLAVSLDGSPLDPDRLSAIGFPDRIRFERVGREWAGSAGFMQHQMRWLPIFAVPGMALLTAGLVLGAWEAIRWRLASLRPLLVIDPGSRLLWSGGAAGLLGPLLTSVGVGLVTCLLLAAILSGMYEGMRIRAGSLVAVGVAATAASIVLWLTVMLSITSPRTRATAVFEKTP